MKVRPVARYKLPEYPTMAAARQAPELLARIPGRWRESPGFAAVLGLVAAFAARVLTAGEPPAKGPEAKVAVTRVPEAPRPAPAGPETVREVGRTTSLVAPLLDEALAHDGRGAFGCVAINPPTFLAEDEALELIRTELEAAGLTLKEDVELDNVPAPIDARAGVRYGREVVVDGDGDETNSMAVVRDPTRGRAPKLAPRAFLFDLADLRRHVFIEYISMRDHEEWDGRDMSTAAYYDFPAVARRVAGAFRKRQASEPALYGVFFDPLAHTELPFPRVEGLSRAQQRLAYAEYRKAHQRERETLNEKAKEKLRKQVRHFVAFLQQEGVVAGVK